MSAKREERFRLVQDLRETEAPALLDSVRRHLRAVNNARLWLCSALVRSVPPTQAARSQDLLDDGFGHPA